jgi:hypothetical protein
VEQITDVLARAIDPSSSMIRHAERSNDHPDWADVGVSKVDELDNGGVVSAR